jgi:hypothetical protein
VIMPVSKAVSCWRAATWMSVTGAKGEPCDRFPRGSAMSFRPARMRSVDVGKWHDIFCRTKPRDRVGNAFGATRCKHSNSGIAAMRIEGGAGVPAVVGVRGPSGPVAGLVGVVQ